MVYFELILQFICEWQDFHFVIFVFEKVQQSNFIEITKSKRFHAMTLKTSDNCKETMCRQYVWFLKCAVCV